MESRGDIPVPSIIPSADAGTIPASGPTFLVIDDDPVQRMTLGTVGRKAGCSVTAVETVEAAIRELTDRSFDCISLDLLLGGQNGILMLGEIARMSANALVLIVSGASPAVREETLQLAANLRLNAVELPKPVDLAMLRQVLTSLSRESLPT